MPIDMYSLSIYYVPNRYRKPSRSKRGQMIIFTKCSNFARQFAYSISFKPHSYPVWEILQMLSLKFYS